MNALVGIVYAIAGARIRARDGEAAVDDATPFALWWAGLAVTATLGCVADALALSGLGDIAWLGAVQMLSLVAITLGIGGLVVHVMRPLVRGPLFVAGVVAAYCIYDAAEFYVMLSQVPAGVRVDGWRPVLDTTTTLDVTFMLATAVGLLLPPLVAGANDLVGGLRVRSRERTLVGLAIVAWCGGIVLVAVPQLGGSDAMQLLARGLVLASGVALYVATASGVQNVKKRAALASAQNDG